MLNHRYSIVKKLGEGGAGEVFLVEDTLCNCRPLALKVLWPEGHPGAVDEAEFLSEVSLLLRLIHPNVIRIFDSGIIRRPEDVELTNRRYYTMEFIEGTDSSDWCSRTIDPSRKSALLESLLAQSLSALWYIHNEGLIHFDIKPRNLILIPPGSDSEFPTVKLTDFGFSKRPGDDGESPLRGTLEYAAPELLRGEPSDHRIDLYSLGATFFHLLEGRCPFEVSDPAGFVEMVLTGEPRFAEGERMEFARLRSVVSGLLHKDPAGRYSSARAAAYALLQGKPVLWRQHFAFSVKPKFVGRKEEREVLARSLDAVRGGDKSSRTSAFVVCGTRGIGKSAIIQEMACVGRSKGLNVFELSSTRPAVPSTSIEPLMAMLQAHARSLSGEGEKMVGRYASVLSLAPEWAGEKDAAIELHARFITDCALLFQFVVIADDLHLMDDFSLQVLQAAVQSAPPGRFLLLAAGPGKPAETLQPPRAAQLHVGELSQDEVREMGRAFLGIGPVGDAVGFRLFEMFGGVPEAVVEALRTVADYLPEEGIQNESAGQSFVEGLDSHLPVSLDDMVIRKIDRLDPEPQAILSVLSSFMNPARVDLLPSLVSQSRDRVEKHLSILELEGYTERVCGGERVLIRAGRIRRALLDSLGTEAAGLHRQIAATMESRRELSSFEDLVELACQLREIGSAEKASQYYEMAADEAAKLLAPQCAAELYETAVEGADIARLAEIKSKLAESYFLAGDYKRAVDTGNQLLHEEDLSTDPSSLNDETRARLLKAVGRAQSALGEYDAARKNMTAALAHVQDEAEQAQLREELVGIDIARGDYVEAEKMCKSQIEKARNMDDSRLLAAALADLGVAELSQGKLDSAVASFSDSASVYTRINQPTRLIKVLINLGDAMSAKGDMEMAAEQWRVALRTAKECGTLSQQARILNNLGLAHYNLKIYDRAKEFYGQARQLFERINSKRGLAYTLANFGDVYMAKGEYENALHCWRDARELYEVMDDLHGLTGTSLHLGHVYTIVGDFESADEVLSEAERLIGENKLDLFIGQLEFMKGQSRMVERSWNAAIESLLSAVAHFEEAGQVERKWIARVKLSRCHFEEGNHETVVEILGMVLEAEEVRRYPSVRAEAWYLLGELARIAPGLAGQKPLDHYERGMELIEKETFTELTWKIAFALAREYHELGQSGPAREHLAKTKDVLDHLLGNFISDELRNQYLFFEQKNRVLSTVEILMKA